MVTRALLPLALAAACQSRQAPPRADAGAAKPVSGSAAHEVGSALAALDVPDIDRRPKHDEPEHVDPGKQLAALGAMPAWQAVVDRTQYLERRDQKGVVYGTLAEPSGPGVPSGSASASSGSAGSASAGSGSAGSAAAGSAAAGSASPYVLLVDETEGNGSLAIRATLPTPQPPGARVALAGAWALDADRRWYWHTSTVTPLPPLPPRPTSDDPDAPSHTIAIRPMPAGVRPISKADDDTLVYFTLAGPPPMLVGDGWPVADEVGSPVVALVSLPGEHPSYGAQDLRTPDERWTLRRGQTYWLRVGIVHKHGTDKPMTMTARTAPRAAM